MPRQKSDLDEIFGGLFRRQTKRRAPSRPRAKKETLEAALRSGKVVLNPDYEASPERKEAMLNKLRGHAHVHRALGAGLNRDPFAAFDSFVAEAQVYFPEDYGKAIPEEGCWIQVRSMAECEIVVEPFSYWYAMPHVLRESADHEHGFMRKQARIITPVGELYLWPYEYTVPKDITSILDCLGDDDDAHVRIHYLSEDAEINVDRLHYVMSRGIPKRQAMLLLLADLHDPNYCYFTMHPGYWAYFLEENEVPTAYREKYRQGVVALTTGMSL